MANLTVGGVRLSFRQMANGSLFGLVPLDLIQFAAYQRDVIPAHCRRIADQWKPLAARPLALSHRVGQLWCYDGRQTMTAMLHLGHTRADATVATGLTYAQEADLFYILNNDAKKMNGWKKFGSAIQARRPVQLSLQAQATAFNLTTPLTPGVGTNCADIANVGTLQEPFKMGGMGLLCRVLTVLDGAWRVGGGDTPVKSSAKPIDLIRGLFRFLHKYQDANIRDVVSVLREIEPEGIRRIANDVQSRGRIDEAQFLQAFEKVMNVGGRIAA